MRGLGVTVAILLVLPATVLAGPTTRLPHPSIAISSDADFLLPTSGVVSGSGDPEDPYVIAGWRILTTSSYGIWFRNTTAHVVVEDVVVEGLVEFPRSSATCGQIVCPRGAFVLDHADNVSFRHVRGVDIWPLANVVGSSNIAFTKATHQLRTAPSGVFAHPPAIDVTDSAGVRFDHVDLPGAGGVVFRRSDAVALADSRIGPTGIQIIASTRVDVADNTLSGTSVSLAGRSASIRIAENAFERPGVAVMMSPFDSTVTGLVLCGNIVTDARNMGVVLYDVSNLAAVRNVVSAPFAPLHIGRGTGISVVENVLTGGIDALSAPPNSSVHGNSFLRGYVALGDGTDATDNWWNSADGPSGAGAGSGVELRTNGNVAISPWLTSVPATPVGCS